MKKTLDGARERLTFQAPVSPTQSSKKGGPVDSEGRGRLFEDGRRLRHDPRKDREHPVRGPEVELEGSEGKKKVIVRQRGGKGEGTLFATTDRKKRGQTTNYLPRKMSAQGPRPVPKGEEGRGSRWGRGIGSGKGK